MISERVKQGILSRLSYDPTTGLFRHKISHLKVRPGDIAGYENDQGYIIINVYGQRIRAHRAAWFVMTGEYLDNEFDVDHEDNNRSNNVFTNLRKATRTQNNLNRGLTAGNKSGKAGVSLRKDTGKWDARIVYEGRTILLGNHAKIEDAINARLEAEGRICKGFHPIDKTRTARPRHR